MPRVGGTGAPQGGPERWLSPNREGKEPRRGLIPGLCSKDSGDPEDPGAPIPWIRGCFIPGIPGIPIPGIPGILRILGCPIPWI